MQVSEDPTVSRRPPLGNFPSSRGIDAMNYAWELSLTADKRPKDLFADMMCRKQSNLFPVPELWVLFYCEHVKWLANFRTDDLLTLRLSFVRIIKNITAIFIYLNSGLFMDKKEVKKNRIIYRYFQQYSCKFLKYKF